VTTLIRHVLERTESVLKLRALPLAAVIVMLVCSTSLAGGRYGAKVTMHLPPGGTAEYFYGLVKTKKGACRARELKLVRDPDGFSGYAPYADGVVSNRDGTWTYDPVGPVVNGYYKAVVAKKSVRSGTCKRSASKPFFVD
jgi:hypothetical protein